MESSMDIGARIRYFRQLRGWSQEKLALQAGLNPAFLGHLERGLNSPTITTLEKIVFALGITLEELFAEQIAHADKKQQAIDRIHVLIQGRSAQEIERIADIVQSVIELLPQAPNT